MPFAAAEFRRGRTARASLHICALDAVRARYAAQSLISAAPLRHDGNRDAGDEDGLRYVLYPCLFISH